MQDFIKIDPTILDGYDFTYLSDIDIEICMYRKTLRINDKNGKVMVLVVPTMLDEIRSDLVDRMLSIFANQFKHTHSSSLSPNKDTILCSHYTWYNRYSVQVSFSFLFRFFTCLL
jgi:hypothetical protein